MSRSGAAPRAAVPAAGVPSRVAAATSNARAEASRHNGAKSRGPKTAKGKARSALNALKHGMRAQKHVVLPEEDGAEFAALEAALGAELAPPGALQTVLARRVEGRRPAPDARRSVGRRNGVGAPFPNPADNRSRCSRSGAGAPTPTPASP